MLGTGIYQIRQASRASQGMSIFPKKDWGVEKLVNVLFSASNGVVTLKNDSRFFQLTADTHTSSCSTAFHNVKVPAKSYAVFSFMVFYSLLLRSRRKQWLWH